VRQVRYRRSEWPCMVRWSVAPYPILSKKFDSALSCAKIHSQNSCLQTLQTLNFLHMLRIYLIVASLIFAKQNIMLTCKSSRTGTWWIFNTAQNTFLHICNTTKTSYTTILYLGFIRSMVSEMLNYSHNCRYEFSVFHD
jgi:hypothetical protein